MARAWRLLVDGPASGPWNMGVDEALLESARDGVATLRFYGWDGPWLSLGYAQSCDEARRAACARAGVSIVKRCTGGSAVLHGADLTYAIAAPSDGLPSGLRESYELVAEALHAGLRRVGVEAHRGPQALRAARSFDCFQAPAPDELVAAGRKLVGSAQRRSASGVLQHGSIRLRPDPASARAAAGCPGEGATSLREIGCDVGVRALRQALVAAFAVALDARLEPAGLTAAEAGQARRRGLAPAAAESPKSAIPRGFSRVSAAGR